MSVLSSINNFQEKRILEFNHMKRINSPLWANKSVQNRYSYFQIGLGRNLLIREAILHQ